MTSLSPTAPTAPTAQLPAVSGATEELMDEYMTLRGVEPAVRTESQAARYHALYAELARRAATPPAGYALPPAAQRWVQEATATGWSHLVQWRVDSYGEVSVTVEVGRSLTTVERIAFENEGHYGLWWKYTAVWNTRDVPATAKPGTLRLFRGVHGESPDRSVFHQVTMREVKFAMRNFPAPD